MSIPWQGAKKAQGKSSEEWLWKEEKGQEERLCWVAGRQYRAPPSPGLCPCLTALPFPGWSLPLLGQQYLDILTTWYCSYRDCCDSGDCRISNDFKGWAFIALRG